MYITFELSINLFIIILKQNVEDANNSSDYYLLFSAPAFVEWVLKPDQVSLQYLQVEQDFQV